MPKAKTDVDAIWYKTPSVGENKNFVVILAADLNKA
jgi:hypothetical protein